MTGCLGRGTVAASTEDGRELPKTTVMRALDASVMRAWGALGRTEVETVVRGGCGGGGGGGGRGVESVAGPDAGAVGRSKTVSPLSTDT